MEWGARKASQPVKGVEGPNFTLLIHLTLHTQKHTLLPFQNHLIPVYSAISSRYSPLYPQYGKGQWFVNLATKLNHRGSSVKSHC